MQFRYTLIDYTTGSAVNTVVEEPVGWDGLTLKLERDKDYHGFFEYADDELSALKFYNDGYSILNTAFLSFGIEAHVDLLIEVNCNGVWQSKPLFLGRIDFDRTRFTCGLEGCFAEAAASKSTCLQALRNRWGQKVDLSATTAFNEVTPLNPYTFIDHTIHMPGKGMLFATSAHASAPFDVSFTDYNEFDGCNACVNINPIIVPVITAPRKLAMYFKINFPNVVNNSLHDFINNDEFLTIVNCEGETSGCSPSAIVNTPHNISETFNFDLAGSLFCSNQVTFNYTATGNLKITNTNCANVGGQMWFVVQILRAGASSPEIVLTLPLDGFFLWNGEYANIPINITLPDTVRTVNNADRLYYGYLATDVIYENEDCEDGLVFDWHFDTLETNIKLESICAGSDGKVTLVNEALSRTVEAVTNDCLRVKSDYFGRTDSQPYSSLTNGCGALEAITNGLKIRNAVLKDGTLPAHQISFKELIDGLNCIHNLGMAIEPDTVRGGDNVWLRVEPFSYFYQNTLVFSAPYVPAIVSSVLTEKYVNTFICGYAKWQAEESGGQDDFHGKREYRTQISTIDNTLTKLSGLMASAYAIEVTRRQYGINNKDWRYDNDNFIICVAPEGSSYKVEVNNITSPVNIYSPQTLYNFRITPLRNAMRWAKHLAQTLLPAYTGTIAKFTFGEGNIVAQGLQNNGCAIENAAIHEDGDIVTTNFNNTADFTPIMYNILDEFEYPLSYTDYMAITANPYGLITYSCNNGPTLSGFIKTISYKPADGKATFQLIRAYIP